MFAGWGGEDDDTEPMDTFDDPGYWFYQAECGIWHRTEVSSHFITISKLFPTCFHKARFALQDDPGNPISSSELETLYFKNPYGITNINTAGGNFKIDFHGNVFFQVDT